jgi:hypothetical protein
MGADFKEKTRKSFEKCWDKAAVEANTPDLFKKAADHAPNRFEAELIEGATAAVGEFFCVRIDGEKVVGRRSLSPVFTIAAPTLSLVQSIKQGCNVARAEVVAVDAISGVLEVIVN